MPCVCAWRKGQSGGCCWSAPTPALVHSWCLQVVPHSTALETCPPCDRWEGLHHAKFRSCLPVDTAQEAALPGVPGLVLEQRQCRLLVCRAGSSLVGGEAHTAFIFVACVTWMPRQMMLSDWSLQAISASISGCVWLSPSPHQGSCRALGSTCPPHAGGFGGCFLQAPPAPQGWWGLVCPQKDPFISGDVWGFLGGGSV